MAAYHQISNHPQKYTRADIQLWRKLMKANDWKQKELAAHLGVTDVAVSTWLAKDARGELRG